ncbi:MAG: hypothetical protein CMG97_10430 [Marinovum sp.]|nr:hypothetical protein [Marinovum sp.]
MLIWLMVDFRDWTGPMTWIGFKRLLVSGETFLILFGGVCTFAARAGAGMKVPGNRTTRG